MGTREDGADGSDDRDLNERAEELRVALRAELLDRMLGTLGVAGTVASPTGGDGERQQGEQAQWRRLVQEIRESGERELVDDLIDVEYAASEDEARTARWEERKRRATKEDVVALEGWLDRVRSSGGS